ncbi:lysophospholipid acyltransferase 7 [Aricia agestis]|uniref:lysophospholipid acyltransferase 7 n=1 Tax=Aricia agestis TaxID=91739 RepID=UPI001C2025B4|nr:lysophospholipid acyltransferase 7 [Aricia agestis]
MLAFILKNKNDIIYLLLLLFSIFIGPVYRNIKTVDLKKWIGTALGLLLVITVSGYDAAHPIISGALGMFAVKNSHIKSCHVVAFFFMFSYLFVFRIGEKFGMKSHSGHTNLVEMIIVLRVVGVAFEMNGSWLAANQRDKGKKDGKDVEKRDGKDVQKKDAKDVEKKDVKDEEFPELINPSLEDLLHYCFNYIGLLTGPYYRYRTFDDYFYRPYSKYADHMRFTADNLRIVPLYVTLYLALAKFFPLEYVFSDEYANRTFFYRIMYPWMLFATFRTRLYSGMTLAECACTACGLGAYPVDGKNRSGHGPTVGYMRLKNMSDEEARVTKYDFNTIECMDVWGCETVVTLRDSMKVWNKAVQYWVAMVVYKRFPIVPLKIHAALFVSVIWHGFHAGYFFCIYFCPFYLMAEDIFYKLYYKNATGMKKKVIGFIMWFLRSHSESYQAAAFLLLTFDRIWIYYSSLYHYWYGVWLVFLILGLILKKVHRA